MATAAAAAAARPCLMDPEAAAKCSITVSSRQTIHFSHHRSQLCSLSMNGCQGVSHLPLGTVETRSFPVVPTPSLALDRLSSAILNSNPPPSSSGIIRLQNVRLFALMGQSVSMKEPTYPPNGRHLVTFILWFLRLSLMSLKKGSMLATTIAWDRALSWTWRDAIDALKATLHQISSVVLKLQRHVPWTLMLRNNNIPCKTYWDLAVNRALQKIRSDSALFKVVLARSSGVITATDIDPIAWFCLQPPNAPAFIGNTPEQLFHRKWLGITSEALAGTRARGESMPEDLQIELELLSSPKDHLEFTIVQESIQRKLENVCDSVQIEPKKAIRKFPRVQLLYAKLAGRLRSEDDEFEILSSLHPSPAVCGFPTEEARVLIAETEVLDRGMYEGPVGWFGGGESEFAVGIRSALVEKGLGVMIYAGTGVVEGSNASLEWDELELKISQLSKLLKLEVPLEIKS